jgi:hypothetical protein
MRRLGVAAIVAGVLVGQMFNGPTTEAFGLYLIVLALLLFPLGLATTRGGRS